MVSRERLPCAGAADGGNKTRMGMSQRAALGSGHLESNPS